MKLSDAAAAAAARILARFRLGLGDHPAEIEAVLAEDAETILVFASAPGLTVTATASMAEMNGTDLEDFARYLEERHSPDAADQRVTLGAGVKDAD